MNGQQEPAIRNVIVTGASSDIGRTVAEYLDQSTDATLILTSWKGQLPTVQRQHVLLNGIDLNRERDARRLAKAADTNFDGPFTLVHSVGAFWVHKPLIHTSFSEIGTQINSHYTTLAATAWALLPLMVNRGGGRLIALSCNSVAYNYPDMSPFTSAKAAVETFVKCIANEYSEFGVTANAVALPTIRTPKVEKEKHHGDRRNYVTTGEIARFVAELIFAAPPIVNGNVIKVFKHSRTFFHHSYFKRNPRALKIVRNSSKERVR